MALKPAKSWAQVACGRVFCATFQELFLPSFWCHACEAEVNILLVAAASPASPGVFVSADSAATIFLPNFLTFGGMSRKLRYMIPIESVSNFMDVLCMSFRASEWHVDHRMHVQLTLGVLPLLLSPA